jgi:aspartate aminotransferase
VCLFQSFAKNFGLYGERAGCVTFIAGDEGEATRMSSRMKEMRAGMVKNLTEAGNPHDWSHVTSQIGMFAYTGLNLAQVDELREKDAIYMTKDGRISIAGLNTHNLDRISAAFDRVTKDSTLGA